MNAPALIDSYGREVRGLRISVTSRCNLNCIYCHREGEIQGGEIPLRTVADVVEAAAGYNVRKVKFSGGEPLLRLDFEDMLASLPEIDEVSATTNGVLLAKRAGRLAASGLDRVNVSLPSLVPARYRSVTGHDTLDRVLEGISSAVDAGLIPVKLNMVLLRGINDTEISGMLDFVRRRENVILQLIELMDSGRLSHLRVDINRVERTLESAASKVEERAMHRRRKYFIDGAEVELVRPVDNSRFCANCTRLRVTSDGKLKPCLFRNDNLVGLDGAGKDEIKRRLELAVQLREPFYRARE